MSTAFAQEAAISGTGAEAAVPERAVTEAVFTAGAISERAVTPPLVRLPRDGYHMGTEDEEVGAATNTTAEEELSEEEEELFLCRSCGSLITTGRARVEIDGGHVHTFVNPSGFIYRIGCFRDAQGCRAVGVPTPEFTWFAGHAWAFADCSACGSHLGWAYYRGEMRVFFGLIMAKLRRATE